MNEKIVGHAVEALVRTGPRAIGAYVRAWLVATLLPSMVAGIWLSMAHQHEPLQYVVLALMISGWVASMIAVPAAVAVAIAYVAFRF